VKLEKFLVCGLGSLGQHCVAALKDFGVSTIAIDWVPPKYWEIPDLPDLLDELIIGDCRQANRLEQAQIHCCRTAIVVTSSEGVNTETALAIRKLNPHTRVIIRSAKDNLNRLLTDHLGNFVAFEPIQLPAPSFALAALGTETLGFFELEGQWLRVVKRQLPRSDRWCNIRQLYELESRRRRILSHASYPQTAAPLFHQWEPQTVVQPGDTLVYLETADRFFFSQSQKRLAIESQSSRKRAWQVIHHFTIRNLKHHLHQFWQTSAREQVRRVALVCGIVVLVLLLVGTLLFHYYYPETTLLTAFYATAILLLGGYADLFGNFQQTAPIPGWLQLFGLGLTVAGTAFVGVLYALLTQALLSSKFQFAKRRPPVPQKDHVVVVGLGRVGRRVVALLQQYKQPLVGVSLNPDFDPTILPEMPLVVGNVTEALAKVNLATAKSVVVVTNDEMLNLEIGLMARDTNPDSDLVIRTSGRGLSENLAGLLPNAQVLCAYAVAAEAFAGAAFGENILSLFRLDEQTILVTEYQIEAGDTLNGLLLAEVAYGYNVVPIVHQKPGQSAKLMPSDDTCLAVGDRMVILATSDGLRRVEQGRGAIAPKGWRVCVEKALTSEAVFEGANAIARVSGSPLSVARDLMNHLPQTVQSPLYKHQAQRLVRELHKAQVNARLVPLAGQSGRDRDINC
jgi:Trk K+ transport system NAD-binding subunit